MKLRTLIFFQFIPFIFLLFNLIVAIADHARNIDVTNDGEAALGLLGSSILFPTAIVAAYFFFLIFPGLLIAVEILVRNKFSHLLNKRNIIPVYTIAAVIEGFWLGLVADVGGSLLHLYIFVLYLLYLYKNSNFVVNRGVIKEKIQKAYFVRLIILIIVTLTVSYYFQEYNKTHPQIEIEIFK